MKALGPEEGRGSNPYYAGNFDGESDELRDLRLSLVAERDALKADLEGRYKSIIEMGNMLTEIVNLIRGEPEEGTSHSTHDAVELVRGLAMHNDLYATAVELEVAKLKAENALLEEVNAQLREQNDAVDKACAKYEADLERIKQSWDEWIKKTEWVQETCQPKELGRHRADVLRMRIETLHAELERIKALPPVAWYAPALDGRSVSYFDGKPMIMVGPIGNEHHTEPLIALGSKT